MESYNTRENGLILKHAGSSGLAKTSAQHLPAQANSFCLVLLLYVWSLVIYDIFIRVLVDIVYDIQPILQ